MNPRLWYLRTLGLLRRHCSSARDLTLLAVLVLVAAYVCWEVDVFVKEGGRSSAQLAIELDEIMLVSALIAIGLLVFVVRIALEQKREMNRRLHAERRARTLAYQDSLTGLANRRQFDEALQAACDAPPAAGSTHALLLMDLNGFKLVNDVHGHAAGDQVLIAVGGRLRTLAREGDLVARFGGDEFAILAHHLLGAEAATSLALRVIKAMEEPVSNGRVRHQVGAGIGIALIPADATGAVEAIRKADIALYRAKAERRSAVRFFEAQMDEQVRSRSALEDALRAAVASGALQARFTPTIDLRTRAAIGFEVVPFWEDAVHGVVPAHRFLPVAEETGLIHDIQDRVLAEACRTARDWPDHSTISIALYPGQLKSASYAARVTDTLAASAIAPSRLEIEVAESTLVQDMQAVQQLLEPLQHQGVRIVLAQFGTGYSSLFHLRNFKVDRIKIDRSFIATATPDPQNEAILEALVGLGRGLGVEVSADGVRSEQHLQSLVTTGCQLGQGERYGERLPAGATSAFFHRFNEASR